ncbi:hypothetical protein MAH1_36730 [Sessilibacter sp. MAH1]
MNDSVVKEALINSVKELEASGEIVVVNPIENAVALRLFEKVQQVSPNMLTASELGGIINALNANKLGFGLDDDDFQTIVGVSKEQLAIAVEKLKAIEW